MPRVKYRRDQRLEEAIHLLIEALGLDYIDEGRVYAAWSTGSTTRAYARIWGLPSPFARLGLCRPMYVIELVSENFQELSCREQISVLVHELLHIPRSFSGGLRSHGEWSRWHNIRGLLARIPRDVAERVCRLLEESAEPQP
ncbi:MAG TPA: metallopeptidase [Pyrodictium sp.]|nr:metallopeptidase [Pyrodictium sp.]